MNGYMDSTVNRVTHVQEKASVRPASTMDQALEELAAKVSAAEVGMERLADKLRPLLSQRESNVANSGNPSPGPNCELEERILQLAHRLGSLVDRIDTTAYQLCV